MSNPLCDSSLGSVVTSDYVTPLTIIVGAEQVVARRFQAHPSITENLRMELRGRVTPEPWPRPPVRTPLEMAAGLLDSEAPRSRGSDWGRAGERFAASLGHSSGRRRHFCRTCKSGRWTARMRGPVPLQGGPSGAAGPSDSCAVVFIDIAAVLEGQFDIVTEVPGESIGFSPDGRLPRIPSLVRTAARDDRCSGVEETCALSPPGSADEEHAGLGLPVAKARSAKKTAKRSAPSGIAAAPPINQRQAEFQATLRAHIEDFADRLAALEVSRDAPIPTSCSSSLPMLGICIVKVEQPSATQGSHSGWSQCRHHSRPSPRQADSRGPTKKRCSSPTSRPCRRSCKAGHSSGQAQKRTLTGGRVRSGSGSGNNRGGVHRDPQRRRIRRRRARAAGRPCPGAAHSTHPSRMPWSYHCGTRGESVGGSDVYPR